MPLANAFIMICELLGRITTPLCWMSVQSVLRQQFEYRTICFRPSVRRCLFQRLWLLAMVRRAGSSCHRAFQPACHRMSTCTTDANAGIGRAEPVRRHQIDPVSRCLPLICLPDLSPYCWFQPFDPGSAASGNVVRTRSFTRSGAFWSAGAQRLRPAGSNAEFQQRPGWWCRAMVSRGCQHSYVCPHFELGGASETVCMPMIRARRGYPSTFASSKDFDGDRPSRDGRWFTADAARAFNALRQHQADICPGALVVMIRSAGSVGISRLTFGIRRWND